MTKEYIKEAYQRLKKKLGHPPSKKELISNTKISDRKIIINYNNYNELVKEMGGIPKSFGQNSIDKEHFIVSYGNMIRKLKKIPTTVDWLYYKGSPSVESFRKKFKIKKWNEMISIFRNYAINKQEWNDIIHLIPEEKVNAQYKKTESEECYVYLMKDKSNFYKIGISNEPEWRERTLQSQQPNIKLITAKKFVNRRIAANIEKALHESYSHKKKRGEWFQLDDEDIYEIKETLKN